MANLAIVTLAKAGKLTQGAGDVSSAFTWANANIGGDQVPLTGMFTLVLFQTSGTACTWTLDSVTAPQWGIDADPTVVCAATDFRAVLIAVADGRFDQGGGNAGFAKFTPSTVTGTPKIASLNIPG